MSPVRFACLFRISQPVWLTGTLLSSWFILSLGSLQPATAQMTGVAMTDLNQVMQPAEWDGSWVGASFPVENFQDYVSFYGDPRSINGSTDFNRGLDILTRPGSYVRSWMGGRVEQITADPNCGVIIVIQSGNWRHSYCNIDGFVEYDASGNRALVDAKSRVLLQEGQEVQTGSRLGQVGMVSQRNQAILHWELQYGDRWVDPADILVAMYDRQQREAEPIARQTREAPSAPASVITALRRAIIGQESTGNFRAVNRHSGALGYAQVMPVNVRAWSIEALGYAVTPRQFLNSRELQLKIIDYKLSQYWRTALRLSGGNQEVAVRMVASQWYSGDPRLYNNARPQYYRGHRYPSIQSYTLSILAKYKAERNN